MKTSALFSFMQKAILLVFVCFASACSKKDDAPTVSSSVVELPTNLVGTFTGQLSYTGSAIISNATGGTATLTRTGDKTYSLTFSDRVPALANLKFQSAAGGSYSTVGSDGSTAGMSLSNNSLSIGVTRGSETWGFTGTK